MTDDRPPRVSPNALGCSNNCEASISNHAMITVQVLGKVRNGICAVGYLTVPLEEYQHTFHSPFFQVVGTGFLVRKTTVITNRHVVQGLVDEQARVGFPSSQLFLSFVVP